MDGFSSSDQIKIRNLSATASLCETPWTSIEANKPIAQPVFISIDIRHNIGPAGLTDDLTKSVDYSAVCKSAQRACSLDASGEVLTAYGLAEQILGLCAADISLPIERISIEVQLPKAVLRAKSASVTVSRRRDGSLAGPTRFEVKELLVHTIVGINPQERLDKQPVVVSLAFDIETELDKSFKLKFAHLERHVSEFIERSAFLTVEALASEIAQQCLLWLDEPAGYTVSVHLAKPAALRFADAPEISITRQLSDFPALLKRLDNPSIPTESDTDAPTKVLAALALGANLGDRFQNIELALRYLPNFFSLFPTGEQPVGDIRLLRTSFLYETSPMYVEDQPLFVNCACLIETTLSALDLLRVCKAIESAVGRQPSIRFGPRAVDLDIIVYGSQEIDTRSETERKTLDNLKGQLVVPHPRMAEREFVLRPLNDIMPEWVHPRLHLPVRSLLSLLLVKRPAGDPPMHKVLPFPSLGAAHKDSGMSAPLTMTYWKLPDSSQPLPRSAQHSGPPFIMATLNVTPDSFSDGSEHFQLDDALAYVRQSVSAGANIIDVGGYSTRPGAAFVSEAEEIGRVVPVIKAIRSDNQLKSIPVSVDTFRVEVARAAIAAGANCINDVYAFSGPEYPPTAHSAKHFSEMRALARETNVPVVLMHSRGDAGSNKDYSMYDRHPTCGARAVLEGVRAELGSKVIDAVEGEGSLRRWQVIVDPGIGFSKTVEGNLELLRSASDLTTEHVWPRSSDLKTYAQPLRRLPFMPQTRNPLAGYPLLIGTSRKSFLGTIISQGSARPAKERDFATAAAVACAVQQGAAVLRVHEVQGMADVVKTAAALWLQ